MLLMERMQGKGDLVGWAEQKHLGWTAVRVVRVPWPDTRITRNNFGYRGLKPELAFGFFGLGFLGFELEFFRFGLRVSGNLPTHRSLSSIS